MAHITKRKISKLTINALKKKSKINPKKVEDRNQNNRRIDENRKTVQKTTEFYQISKELTTILYKLFQKTEEERTLSNSLWGQFYRATKVKDVTREN